MRWIGFQRQVSRKAVRRWRGLASASTFAGVSMLEWVSCRVVCSANSSMVDINVVDLECRATETIEEAIVERKRLRRETAC